MDCLANHSFYQFWQTIVFVIFAGGPVLILVLGPGLALNGPTCFSLIFLEVIINLLVTSDVVETTCFKAKTEFKTAKFSRDQDRDQDRSSFETFGSRPRPEIIDTKTETGNYLASKNKIYITKFNQFFFYFSKKLHFK